MFDEIMKAITGKRNSKSVALSSEELAEFLNTTPGALEAFENAYKQAQEQAGPSDNFFEMSKDDFDMEALADAPVAEDIASRIVDELLSQTQFWFYDRQYDIALVNTDTRLIGNGVELVTRDEIDQLPVECRPQLTGLLAWVDMDEPSAPVIFWNLKKFMETGDKTYYHMFRQGLDILDLDPVTYETLGCNRNSIGNWLPQLVRANAGHNFFKIPSTKIIKVPMTLLQLTRQPYQDLTATTKAILNDFVFKAFELDKNGDYFVKTGTHSSKFDFRNARVREPKEVRELGEYLLFIHHQALRMAGPLTQPSVYGVSTTNEWVVREFIKDKEDNPTIYHGMPLHTEFRVFVDCDSDEVLSVENYWKPEVMTARFAERRGNGIDDKHDAVTYAMNMERLCKRYKDNKKAVCDHIAEILPGLNLSGQWSIDVMMNGDDFWLIDMAVAENSAYYESVPETKRIPSDENWIPKLPKAIRQ